MHNSKLINTIKKLPLYELEGVQKLLKTDLLIKGSSRVECENLIAYILDNYENLETDALTKEKTSKIIFNNSSPNINRLEKTMSALLNAIEFYIVHFLKNIDTERTVHYNLTLSKFYRQNSLQRRSEIFISDSIKHLETESNFLNTSFFYLKSIISEERFVLDTLNNKVTNENQYLDLLLQFKNFAALRELELIFKTVYNTLTFSEPINDIFSTINKQIEENTTNIFQNELLKIYQYSILMLQFHRTDEFYSYFDFFLIALSKCKIKLSKDLYNQFATAQRVCLTLRYNYEPNTINVKNQLDTYKLHLEEGLLFLNGRIVGNTATNIVMYSVKLKQNEWAKYFLETYQEKIGYLHEDRDEIVALCWAIYYFANKEYDKVEKQILPKYTNIYNTLITRRMRIKIYYETDEIDLMLYEIESYKQFVYRHFDKKEINEDHYDANRLFLDRLKQILNLQFNPNASKKLKLIEKIEKQKCSDKEWLLEKIHALKY